MPELIAPSRKRNIWFKSELKYFICWRFMESIGKSRVYPAIRERHEAVDTFVDEMEEHNVEMKIEEVRLSQRDATETLLRFSINGKYQVVIDGDTNTRASRGAWEYWIPEHLFLMDPIFYAQAIIEQVDPYDE
jgi:hypothetical protein